VRRIDRNVWVVVLILLAAIAPAVFAGVARFVRLERAVDLDRERSLVADYARKLEEAHWRQQAPSEAKTQEWRLLGSGEVTGTLQVLQSLVDSTGVTLVAAKAAPSGKGGRQTYLLTGSGRPEQVCTLLAGIERCSRLVVVENGRITPQAEEIVDFELGLATYHRGDK